MCTAISANFVEFAISLLGFTTNAQTNNFLSWRFICRKESFRDELSKITSSTCQFVKREKEIKFYQVIWRNMSVVTDADDSIRHLTLSGVSRRGRGWNVSSIFAQLHPDPWFTMIGTRTLAGGQDRSTRTELESNWKQSCKLLSEAGSSRSYPRETKARSFWSRERDAPWNLSQVPVDTSVRRWNFPVRGNHFPKARGQPMRMGREIRKREARERKGSLLEMHGLVARTRRGLERLAHSYTLKLPLEVHRNIMKTDTLAAVS